MKRAWTGFAAVLLLAGCTSSGKAGPSSSAPAPSPTASASQPRGLAGGDGESSSPAAPRSTILSTPKPTLSAPVNVAEKDGTCPYISGQDFADGEGSRVGRVTVLQSTPVGCRFYFQYDDTQIVGEIDVETFKTATQAYNAMVGSATGHPEVQSSPTIGAGAVAYKAPLQGNSAWLCVFAKGTAVITVRTRQPYPANNAFNLARAIAPRFP